MIDKNQKLVMLGGILNEVLVEDSLPEELRPAARKLKDWAVSQLTNQGPEALLNMLEEVIKRREKC